MAMLTPEYLATHPTPENSTLTRTVREADRIWLDDVPVDVLLVHPDGRCVVQLAERPTTVAVLNDKMAWVVPPGVALYTSAWTHLPGAEDTTRINFYARDPKASNDGRIRILTDDKKATKPAVPKRGVTVTRRVPVSKIRGTQPA